MHKSPNLVLISLLLIFSNCSKEPTYTEETIDGVRYVHNFSPLWGEEQRISLEFVRQVGELENADENYLFFQPRDLEVDNYGNIYILDTGNYRIQKFDPGGRYLITIGSKGEGPGEFLTTSCIQIDKDNNLLYVSNFRKRILIVFSLEGEYIKDISTQYMIRKFLLNANDTILSDDITSSYQRHAREGLEDEMYLFGTYDMNGNFKSEFGKSIDLGNRISTWEGNLISFAVDEEGFIFTSFIRQNRIEKYSPDGTLLFHSDRELNFDWKIYEYDIDVGDGRTERRKRAMLTSTGAALDSKNRFWVGTVLTENYKPADVYKNIIFEIYNEDGILLQSMPVPVYFSYMKIFGDKLYLLDTLDNMCVYVYRIIER
ncbi:NHL repeat-containing protein [candidate division KSB1 bacterium]